MHDFDVLILCIIFLLLVNTSSGTFVIPKRRGIDVSQERRLKLPLAILIATFFKFAYMKGKSSFIIVRGKSFINKVFRFNSFFRKTNFVHTFANPSAVIFPFK